MGADFTSNQHTHIGFFPLQYHAYPGCIGPQKHVFMHAAVDCVLCLKTKTKLDPFMLSKRTCIYTAWSFRISHCPCSYTSERIDGVSCCVFGPVNLALCQKHTTLSYNLCSHKLPNPLLHSGTIPGRNKLPSCAMPSHSLPAVLGAWMGKWLRIKRLFPLLNRFSKTWKIPLKTKWLSLKERWKIYLKFSPMFPTFMSNTLTVLRPLVVKINLQHWFVENWGDLLTFKLLLSNKSALSKHFWRTPQSRS